MPGLRRRPSATRDRVANAGAVDEFAAGAPPWRRRVRAAELGTAMEREYARVLAEEFPAQAQASLRSRLRKCGGDLVSAYHLCFRAQFHALSSRRKLRRACWLQKANAANSRMLLRRWQGAGRNVRIVRVRRRGNVLVAQRAYRPGEEIFRDSPLLLWDADAESGSLSDMYWLSSEHVQGHVLGLYAGEPAKLPKAVPEAPLLEVVNRLQQVAWYNGLPISVTKDSRKRGRAGGLQSGFFRILCRASHSCQPNADFVPVGLCGAQAVVCRAPVRAGEEVTISYLNKKLQSSSVGERRQWLRQHFGFDCSCERCAEEK